MKTPHSCHRWLALVLALAFAPGIQAGSTITSQIIAQTAAGALTCMRWMPVGMCFWLRCSWSGCSVRTSLKVGHYNPDLVVSAYNELGGNPWAEIRATLGLAHKAAATGLLLTSVATAAAYRASSRSARVGRRPAKRIPQTP